MSYDSGNHTVRCEYDDCGAIVKKKDLQTHIDDERCSNVIIAPNICQNILLMHMFNENMLFHANIVKKSV